MSFKAAVSLLAVAQAVQADFSHEMHFKKVDAATAKHVAGLKGQSSAIGALVNDQGFWFSHFTVGGSPDLEILIDTGSSDAIMNPGIYQPGSDSVDTGNPFQISYATTNPDGSGEESASGEIYQDVITQLGSNLSVAQQALGAITDPSDSPTFPHDGLIGYAGIDGSALQASPFIQSLCDQGSLSACRFGLALKADQTGTLYYGSVGTSEFTGQLTTVPISDEWAIRADVTVNNATVASRASIQTDSGTTVIFGPTSQVRSIFKKLGIHASENENGVSGYYDCDQPFDFGLSIGGVNFNVLPEALYYAKDGNNCTASIHGSDSFGNTWLVGQAFFQGKYIDHNIDGKSMGFANLS